MPGPAPSRGYGVWGGAPEALQFDVQLLCSKAIRNLTTAIHCRLESFMKRMQLCDQRAIFQWVDRNDSFSATISIKLSCRNIVVSEDW